MNAFFIFLMMLVGYREPDGLTRYQAAIEAATEDPEERLLLGTVVRTENYFHLGSRTPPFGLTWESFQRRQRCWALERRQNLATRAAARARARGDTPVRDPVLDESCEPAFTIETGAIFALRSLRALRRTCHREVPGPEDTVEARWALAMGRYHHGTGGAHHGCWADPLAARQISWMTSTPPRNLPRHTNRYRAAH